MATMPPGHRWTHLEAWEGCAATLVGFLVALHVGDAGAEAGVGAVVGVLQGVGLGAAARAEPPRAEAA